MNKFSQRRSRAQERSAAKDVGGRVQIASGATPFAKGDVRAMGKLRVECKTTSKHVYTLKLTDLLKIRDEALTQGLESWVFQIEFQGGMGIHQKAAVLDAVWFTDLNGGQHSTEMNTNKASMRIFKEALIHQPVLLSWMQEFSFKPPIHYKHILCPWSRFVELYEKEV